MHRITKLGDRLLLEKYRNSSLGEGWFIVKELTPATPVTEFLAPAVNPLTHSASVQLEGYKLIFTSHKSVHLLRPGTDTRGSSRWEPTETIPFDKLLGLLRWTDENGVIDFAEVDICDESIHTDVGKHAEDVAKMIRKEFNSLIEVTADSGIVQISQTFGKRDYFLGFICGAAVALEQKGEV